MVTNGLEQVRFPHPDAPVQKQRVINRARFGGYGHAGGMSEFVVFADDERFERVPWVEPNVG
jgi:hypothetical protein